MNYEHLEMIAALIDGRLRVHERFTVLRLFAESRRARLVLADSIELLREVGRGANPEEHESWPSKST